MAHSLPPSETSTDYLPGPDQYPESVALWHPPSLQAWPHAPPPTPPTTASTPPQSYPEAPKPNPRKHPRTTGSCLTCRARRIKCDETHPACNPCRKGHRVCVYPSPSSTDAASQSAWRSMEPVSVKEASGSHPIKAGSRLESTSARSALTNAFSFPRSAHLPEDLQFYLSFYQESFTPRHFFLPARSNHFVHHSIIKLALQYDLLLYVVVGFAAYHHCVQAGGGQLYPFLKYYKTALNKLHNSLTTGEAHSEATLITILVLSTFEEFLGDRCNLIKHHKAANVLVRELLTPESISTNELHDHIFLWYSHFDVVAGIWAGNEAVLSREWYVAKELYDEQQAAAYPNNAEKQLALVASMHRRLGLEMASLYVKLSRQMITLDQFIIENDHLGRMIERTRLILQRFTDSEYTVWEHPGRQPSQTMILLIHMLLASSILARYGM